MRRTPAVEPLLCGEPFADRSSTTGRFGVSANPEGVAPLTRDIGPNSGPGRRRTTACAATPPVRRVLLVAFSLLIMALAIVVACTTGSGTDVVTDNAPPASARDIDRRVERHRCVELLGADHRDDRPAHVDRPGSAFR